MFLEVQDGTFSYGSLNIFRNINLGVSKGQIYCLFGPNGCGKSTLLDCIMGILKLQNGKIMVNGRDIRNLGQAEMARCIAYVPQLHERFFPYRVQDFVLMGRTPYTSFFSSPHDKDMDIVMESLETLGISDLKDQPYTQLSGGELQMVMIARALVQETPVIIMDEPTSHLDFKNDIAIMEKICCLVREKNRTIIMASHFPNQGFYFENKGIPIEIILMNRQKDVIVGKPSEVFTEDNMRTIFSIESKVIACPMDGGGIIKQIVPVGPI